MQNQPIVVNNNKKQQPETIDLVELFFALLRKWFLILFISALFAGGAFAYSYLAITPTYDSTTKIYILNRQGNDNSSITQSDLNSSSQLLKDYMALIKTRPVIEGAIEKLGLNTTYEMLVGSISVSNTTDTRIISITATRDNAQSAKELADAVRDEVAKQIVKVMNVESVNTVEEANLPTTKARPNNVKNGILGGIAGFVFICAIIIIIYLTDDRIKTSEDVEKYLGLSVLGSIPFDENLDDTSKKHNKSQKSQKEKTTQQEKITKTKKKATSKDK